MNLGDAPTVIAMATIRDIVEGEELSIDYNPSHSMPEVWANFENNEKKVKCLCEAQNCRGWVF